MKNKKADMLLRAARLWQNYTASGCLCDPDQAYRDVVEEVLWSDYYNHTFDSLASAALSEVCFNMGFEVEDA